MMENSRPRILLVNLEMPEARGGGMLIREFSLVKYLHENYRFTVLCVREPMKEDRAFKELEALCESVITVPPDSRRIRSKWTERVERWGRLIGPNPIHVLNYYPVERFRRKAREVLSSGQYDILHVDHPEMSAVLFDAPAMPKVLGIDIISLKLETYLKISVSKRDYLYRFVDLKKFRRYEQKAIAACDLFIVCSEKDRDAVHAIHPTKPVVVVPNGIDLDFYMPKRKGIGRYGSLLFVGSLGALQNEDGIVHFHREVLPRIIKEVPEVHLTIVGRNPSPRVMRLSNDYTSVTGWVDDVRPYYEKARVVIAPIRSGGGTSLKIPEAFAMRRPVVSTSFGSRGFDVENGRHLLIADRPEDVAKAVITLLRDKGLCDKIGRAGEQWCRENMGWKDISLKLDAAYKKVLEDYKA